MKTIKLFFLVLILFLMRTTAFAQDDFYNEPPKNDTEIVIVNQDSLNSNSEEDSYVTQKDYLDREYSEEEIEDYEEELSQKEREERRRRRNRADFAADVIFEVIVNTAFIIVAFWQ